MSYGRTNAGTRSAPFNLINRENVKNLEIAWTYRTGDPTGVDQNTPLQIGGLVYSCTPNNVVAALDADTGELKWKYDPEVSTPYWPRCRGVGFYDATETIGETAICAKRIILASMDARLIAMDATTGTLCPDFGENGIASTSAGMGVVKPGFHKQTGAVK